MPHTAHANNLRPAPFMLPEYNPNPSPNAASAAGAAQVLMLPGLSAYSSTNPHAPQIHADTVVVTCPLNNNA